MTTGLNAELSVSLWRGAQHGHYETYRVPQRQSQTVLDVVTFVQRHIDPTLSYRFACRVGVCGSCAMTVNGKPRWTCRTHVAKVAAGGRLEIGPLENLPVIKDLATDMQVFFEKWQQAKGVFAPTKTRHDAIAQMVGKSRSHVSNTMRLLKLPESVKAYINAGAISAGAARMLVGAADPERMASEIVERGLNVRQVEALAKERAQSSGKSGKRQRAGKSADTLALEHRLSDALGLTVTLAEHGEGGVLQIHYRAPDQLEHVLQRLERN